MAVVRITRLYNARSRMVMSFPTEARSPFRLPPSTLVALLVAGAFFMENLDGTVIATALPQMAQTFGVGFELKRHHRVGGQRVLRLGAIILWRRVYS